MRGCESKYRVQSEWQVSVWRSAASRFVVLNFNTGRCIKPFYPRVIVLLSAALDTVPGVSVEPRKRLPDQPNSAA